jgi:hypothetical protein
VSGYSTRSKEFISEPVVPVGGLFDAAAMASGEPGLPAQFVWRGDTYAVARVLDRWKTVGECRHHSGEKYVRKHWFRVQLTDGAQMELYFDRQPRTRQKKQRWWLAAIVEEGNSATTGE